MKLKFNILSKKFTIFILFLFLLVLSPAFYVKADTVSAPKSAVSKQYGILISDRKNSFTWYDLNDSNTAHIEQIDGNIMVPAWKTASLIPDISYSYNKTTQTLTLKNITNNKKITCKKSSSSCTYYSGSKSKGTVKKMAYKMYISSSSKSVMVPADILKLVLNTASGYQYYNQKEMQKKGYNTLDYEGIIVYNPYRAIKELPLASNVNGLSSTIKVTIPEGYSAAQTFDLLVKKGVCSDTSYLYEACENYDFSYYPLIAELEKKELENRCFRLEGYLYPDTYEFYRLSSGQDAIGRFLRNIHKKITEDFQNRADELGVSMDEILILASIIEKETGDAKQMPFISSVLWNRLKINMKLQVDAASYYVERYIKPYIDGDINRFNNFYNTYKCNALPAGPICSPGLTAIKAALYPAEIEALFFCSDENGEYYYAEDYTEHLDNLQKIKALSETQTP